MYYLAEYNVSGEIHSTTFNRSNSFRGKLSSLSSGTKYNISIFAVGENGTRSDGSCDISNYTSMWLSYLCSRFIFINVISDDTSILNLVMIDIVIPM